VHQNDPSRCTEYHKMQNHTITNIDEVGTTHKKTLNNSKALLKMGSKFG